jgi:hypothetical protein
MSPSRSRLDRLTRWSPRPGFSQGAGLLAWASLVVLAAAGCKGEQALYSRDAAAWSDLGGAGFGGGSGGTATGGHAGAGMAGHGGSVATGGAGGAGNKGGGGGMAGGAAGQNGGTGGQQPTGMFGDHCQSTADCQQGSCTSGFCCNIACTGTCQTCDSSGNTCIPVESTLDPRGDCHDTGAASCGSNGTGCNGAGACNLYPTNTVCDPAPMCSGTGSLIPKSVCNGQGRCNPGSPVSCNGYLCQSNACLLTCKDGTACVTGGFCGAGTCVGPTPNLAGNGDFEYGTTDGWSTIPSGAGLSVSTVVNSGAHSAEQTTRSTFYIGPGYYIPTGLGRYHISLWAMQNQVTAPPLPLGLLQLSLLCVQTTPYYTGNVKVPMPSGVWVNLTADIDTSMDSIVGSDCVANPKVGGILPGLVRSAVVLLDEDMNDAALPDKTFPNFYVDDLVVTVDDNHNLVGNPNFEVAGGFVDGWSTNAADVKGTAMLSVSTTQHNGGSHSLWERNRSRSDMGIRYALPIGAANYAVTFYVMQSGVTAHALQLWAAYSCAGDPANSVRQKAIAQTAALPGGTMWAALSSSAVAFPPSDAAASCKQMTGAAFWVTQVEQGTCGTQSGQVECPDLFLDDATIALTTAPPTD